MKLPTVYRRPLHALRANPLWIAHYGSTTAGPLPASWGVETFWRFADSGRFPGCQDVFNGSYPQLVAFALGLR